MGCTNSAENTKKEPISVQRRRLSLENPVEELAVQNQVESFSEEESRAFVAELSSAQLMDMLNNSNTEGRKWSIGSETDKGLEEQPAFTRKTMSENCREAGGRTCKDAHSAAETMSQGVGFTCRKGLKPEAPNQDSFLILRVENDFSLYGVFDGHGFRGHEVSNFVKETFPKVLLKDDDFRNDPGQALTKSFSRLQRLLEVATRTWKTKAVASGTTASVILHRHSDNKIFVAHCGDSRCVLGRGDGTKLKAVDLTVDHVANAKDEKERIKRAGGVVMHDGFSRQRVYAKGKDGPGLKKTRSIGDIQGHEECGITETPDLLEQQLSDGNKDHVLLLCSDAVWEFMSSQQAMDIVGKFGPGEANEAAEELASNAWDRWIEADDQVVDDITVIVHFLELKS